MARRTHDPLGFIAYLAALLGLGFVAEHYTKGLDRFLLGDRKMGPWLTALSYETTAYCGWLMLGYPGRVFSRGFAAVWAGLACVVGDSLNWLLVSKRLRNATERLRAIRFPSIWSGASPLRYIGGGCGCQGSHIRQMARALGRMPMEEREWQIDYAHPQSATEAYKTLRE